MADLLSRDDTRDVDALLGLPPGSGRRSRRLWIVAPALLLAAAGAVAYGLSGRPSDGIAYLTEPAARGDLHVIVTATGSVQPTSQVEISSELSGTIRRVHVDFNSTVAAGQVIAELDTDKFKASVDSSRAKRDAAVARVAQAEVTLDETARDYERKKALAGTSAGNRHDFDAARAAYNRAVTGLASAKAEVLSTEADLTLNESNLAKTRITAPVNGVVLKRNVDPGQTVAASLQAPVLFTIAEDLRQMEVQVNVDEADVGKVREGQSATFSVDAYPERRFPARIRELRYAPETVQGVVTYKAVLTVDNAELLLRPGMTATAEIGVQDVTGALLVPNAALRFTPPASEPQQSASLLRRLLPGPPQFRAPSRQETAGPARAVWVLRDGAPAAVPVRVGASDGKRTEIQQGDLADGQPVIVDSAAKR
ncbi:efflux RND transporter periplasmic adaptor subunit [Azospirillum sp. TSO22-1]|uniref:efflux RND transporter periplasmic adaptor subunit n=1 Tax=Azospirillum sp. TSO22-1 TaxID=716789 RepID=UPI000D614222|nr:efflux RND transporter periplasmic adaptor subunit [Azospirillum sp. TSO22-1]PWC31792.1 hemolysin secretion protein D [Azospirillum sp. TSO22-1]